MGVRVIFDYTSWSAVYVQFQKLSQPQILGLLPLAEQYVVNDGSGPNCSAPLQTQLLNLMMAHLAQIFYGVNGDQPSPLVGRISSAEEGSVNVQTEWPETPGAAWFLQTPFGAAFWQLSLPFRTMRYIPGPRRYFNPWINQ